LVTDLSLGYDLVLCSWANGTDRAGSGFSIDLLWDSSVASAPSTFKTATQSAATMLQTAFSKHIAVGWGEIGGGKITQPGIAEAGPNGGIWIGYANPKSNLSAHATSTDGATAIAALVASIAPNGNGNVAVWRPHEKPLGLLAVNDTGCDVPGSGRSACSGHGIRRSRPTQRRGVNAPRPQSAKATISSSPQPWLLRVFSGLSQPA
jgi:hypothetical protein